MPKHIIERFLDYMGELYCPAIARKAVMPIIYSAINSKFVPLEAAYHTRYRLNIMYQWGYGYWKSTILIQMSKLFPFRHHLLTSTSAAAIRGSFSTEGRFYPPELLINEVLVISEFTAVLEGDKEVYGILLTAMEEGIVRVAIVKASKIGQKDIDKIHEYGADIADGRLEYINMCSIWAATHTLDGITDRNRDAICSRFYMIHIPPSDFPAEASFHDPTKLVDNDLEMDVSNYFQELMANITIPDNDFAREVVQELKAQYEGKKVNPRVIGDIRRMAVAHHEIFPDQTAIVVAKILKSYTDDTVGMNNRELLADYLCTGQHTFAEIENYTGMKKANIFSHFNRMKVKSTDSKPKRYYLEGADIINPYLNDTILSNKGSMRSLSYLTEVEQQNAYEIEHPKGDK